jgi:hypothetical protein
VANYEGRFRSNYFRVRDPAAFVERFCARWGVKPITKKPGDHGYPADAEGVLHGFMMSDWDDSGSIPSEPVGELLEGLLDEDEARAIAEAEAIVGAMLATLPDGHPDFIDELAAQLADGWVAVVEYAGWEKLRYLNAGAIAVNNKGERVEVCLGDLHRSARDLGDFITEASY